MSSREAAIRSAVKAFAHIPLHRRFDGFDVRVATLDTAGYLDLLGLVFDAAAEQGHIHYSDDCPRSKKRLAHLRGQKRESDLRARELVAERDVLYAIVRALSAVEDDLLAVATCQLVRVEAAQRRLADVFMAVEWWDSGEDAVRKALDKYRGEHTQPPEEHE